jgi:hypothetical protein
LVVFLDAVGGWSVAIGVARILADDLYLAEALAYGKNQHEERVVVDAYAVVVTVGDTGPVPIRLREKIRAERGPTIAFGDAERARLAVPR